MSTPEGAVKNKINKVLSLLPNCYKFCPVQYGLGAPSLDYLICVNGFFVSVEAKKPGGRLTARQLVTKAAMEAAGAQVFVVSDHASLEIMKYALQKLAEAPRI